MEEFKELKAKWDQKLKESGFEEIENGPFLKLWHSTYFYAMYSVEEIEENQQYYRMAADFYWRYRDFKSDLHREVWRLHSEGYSRRKVAQILKREGHKISADSIQIIVSGLKKIMHTRKWPSSERGPYEQTSDPKDRLHGLPGLPTK